MSYQLGPERQKKLVALLSETHRVSIRLEVLDLDFKAKGHVSHMFLDGQVSYDSTAPVTRSLDLTLRDPLRQLRFDSDSPHAGALYADRMIRVYYGVIATNLMTRFDVPVFTGPITGLDRNGSEASLEAQGRDVLGMSPVWVRRSWKEGTKRTNVIRQILTEIMGEKHLEVPDRDATLPRDMSLGPDTAKPWEMACNLAQSMGFQLFYDGMGTARMRRISSATTFTFRHDKMVKTQPTTGYDNEELVNCVEVLGAKPKGKKRIHVRLVADRQHPLSPWKLGTDKAPRFAPAFYEDDSIKTLAEAKAFAKRMLAAGLEQSVEVAFESLPYPLGDPGDTVKVDVPDFVEKFRLRQHTLPLSVEGASTIGYLKNVKPNRKAIRARRAS